MKTIEDLLALGVVACPHCGLMIEADQDKLIAHMDQHPDVVRKLQLDLALESLCESGIIRQTR